ncbi:MAG: TetR/AcrR family transcriptional regulator [Polyangiaceae bacterium]|nr:TetR/AcrR family transcriptional regulator [Polyangiaceae bacterium]
MTARGRYRKSAVSKRQVVEAAVRALATNGYAHTSVSDIAAEAGLSKGAVHYHFESKEDLVSHVADHCAAAVRERVRQAWQAPGTPLERLRSALREMRSARREGAPELRVIADLMVQAINEPKLRPPISAMFVANRAEVVSNLRETFDALGLETRLPMSVVPRLLLATLDGLALHDFFDPGDAALDDAIEQAIEEIAATLFVPKPVS